MTAHAIARRPSPDDTGVFFIAFGIAMMVLAIIVATGCKKRMAEALWKGLPEGAACVFASTYIDTCIAGGRVYTCITQSGEGCEPSTTTCAPAAAPAPTPEAL